MRISEILEQNQSGVSFEFFPPKTDKGKAALARTIRALKGYKPLYTSMTYGAGGTTEDKTKEAVYMLLEEKDLVVMPHLTCIGAREIDIKDLLDEYKQKGVQNIMVLRGDPPVGVLGFDFSKQEFSFAKDLVSFINKENNFCIGVAVYPEGHIEAASLEEDIEYTKQKIDAGASFAVTQMFFDNSYYYKLLDRMKKKEINIPTLPGILPLTNISKVKEFASVCRTTIPEYIEERMQSFKNSPEDMEKCGIEFTIKQCQDLIKNGIKYIHFFTLNKPTVIKTILDAVL